MRHLGDTVLARSFTDPGAFWLIGAVLAASVGAFCAVVIEARSRELETRARERDDAENVARHLAEVCEDIAKSPAKVGPLFVRATVARDAWDDMCYSVGIMTTADGWEYIGDSEFEPTETGD